MVPCSETPRACLAARLLLRRRPGRCCCPGDGTDRRDAPASAAAVDPSQATVELSPFEVRADSDVGYQAGNTVSGSRLKDTPASISPFTLEFLSDIAATNLEDMLGYANNVEAEFENATAGFNNPPGRDTTGNDYQFRMRGMAAGAARDFMDSSVPT